MPSLLSLDDCVGIGRGESPVDLAFHEMACERARTKLSSLLGAGR